MSTKKSVVIFVHGLGADNPNWWGSTESALRNNPELIQQYDIRFFTYKTDKIKTIINDAKNVIGLGEVQALLKDLGLQLVTYLKHNCDNYSSIKLFGHSMGGLVIGASLPTLQQHHNNIYDKISSVAFAGTPLGGSKVATVLKKFLGFIVSSQTKSISLNDDELLSITSTLPNYLTINESDVQPNKKHLIFFRIGEDEVVKEDSERYGSFQEDIQNYRPYQYTLTGKHSESVQNLAANSLNFKEIVAWINPSIENSNYYIVEREISKTYLKNKLVIQDFNQRIKVTDTSECIIEFYHGFLKDVDHLANKKYLNKLKKNIIKRNNKLTGISHINDTKVKIDRFKYPIILGQKDIDGTSITNIKIDNSNIQIHETDTSLGLLFKFNLGQYPVGTILDCKFSFTLPTDIYDAKQPDFFRFKKPAGLTKITIQEEIYGSSLYQFEVRWKRNGIPCIMGEPTVNLYYRKHYGEFKQEKAEDVYEVSVEFK